MQDRPIAPGWPRRVVPAPHPPNPDIVTRPLLFLSHRLPFPPHNGASIRTYNILKQLAREYEVTALCFDRTDPALGDLPLEGRVEALRPFARVEVFPIPQESSRYRLVRDHLFSVLTGNPYTYYVHDLTAYGARLSALLHERTWAAVHLDSMDLLRYVPMLAGTPMVCTHHNVESALLRRRAGAETSVLLRRYMRHQAALLERAERRLLGRFALNVAVSGDDARSFAALAPEARISVVPNGVDTESFRPAEGPTRGCVFVGGTSWFPNRDGLAWFVQAILPALERRHWGSEVVWVGRATPEELIRHQGTRGLRLTGYVEDIRPYVNEARCFIAPLRVGGGTRLKILDAWALGKAVVSTSIGAEGLLTRDGDNILLADTPEAFAAAMVRLLGDEALAGRLGAAARQTVEEHYSWDIIGRDMLGRYREVEAPAS